MASMVVCMRAEYHHQQNDVTAAAVTMGYHETRVVLTVDWTLDHPTFVAIDVLPPEQPETNSVDADTAEDEVAHFEVATMKGAAELQSKSNDMDKPVDLIFVAILVIGFFICVVLGMLIYCYFQPSPVRPNLATDTCKESQSVACTVDDVVFNSSFMSDV